MKWILLVAPSLLLGACYKRETQPRESFTLHGRVVDCVTRQPVAGATVWIVADDGSRSGLFSSSTREAGSTHTDDSGRFALVPLAFATTQRFDLSVQQQGYNGAGRSTTRADIIASGSSYSYDEICLNR